MLSKKIQGISNLAPNSKKFGILRDPLILEHSKANRFWKTERDHVFNYQHNNGNYYTWLIIIELCIIIKYAFQHTVNEICSRSNLISNSCLPILSGGGQFRSSSFVTSLSRIILLNSSITEGLNVTKMCKFHTIKLNWHIAEKFQSKILIMYNTFFSDHRIIFVIGVIRITKFTISGYFKLHEFVPELSLVTNIITAVKIICHAR